MDDRTRTIIEELQAEVKRLKERVEFLEQENRWLREELEKAQQHMARQAAPFRREERKKIPPDQHKPAGRKPGHPGSCRQEPDHIDQTIELPLSRCPRCAGPLTDIERMEEPEKGLSRALRQVYGSLLLNGPFAVIVAHEGEMIGLTDRIRLRPLTVGEKGDMLYLSSEESAIRLISPELDKAWIPVGGQPVIGRLKDTAKSKAVEETLAAGDAP